MRISFRTRLWQLWSVDLHGGLAALNLRGDRTDARLDRIERRLQIAPELD